MGFIPFLTVTKDYTVFGYTPDHLHKLSQYLLVSSGIHCFKLQTGKERMKERKRQRDGQIEKKKKKVKGINNE
jgi:hypothetical protein